MPTTDTPRRYRVVDGHRYLVVVHGGVEGYVLRFVASCTGCFECEDGYPIGDYPTHPVHQCYVGSGCSECGYHGIRKTGHWLPFDDYMEDADANTD